MKSLILLFFFSFSLSAVNIDTNLYDGNNTMAYYEEVEKLIAKEEPQDELDTERIATERTILSTLKTIISSTPKTNPLPDTLLSSDENISSQDYLTYLDVLVDTSVNINTLKEESSTLEEKMSFLKKSISDIVAEDKKNLRLYQLQYASYKLKTKNNIIALQNYEGMLEKGKELFNKKLKQVVFNTEELEKKLQDTSKKLNSIDEKSISLKLKKERELMTQESLSKELEKNLLENQTTATDILTAKIDETLHLSLAYLKQKESDKLNSTFKESKTDIKKLDDKLEQYYGLKRNIIKDLMGSELGTVTVALSDVGQSAENVYQYTYDKLNEPLFSFSEKGISTIDILKVLLVLILGFMIASFYKRKIMNLATREKISHSSAKMISSAGYYLLVFITLLISLKSIGLDLSNLGIIAGALSIGIGFGLQTLVSNLAAGIILMFERTIRIGDYIEVSDTIRGTVSDMKMRSTTVTTNDNIDVIIPNSSFVQNNVINWTLENDIRRIHIPFSVAYGTPNEKVEEVIFEELKLSNINYVSRPPRYTNAIWMTAMGSSSVDYELIIWIKGTSTLKPSGTKSDFLKFIYATLNKHDIAIPFPQLDLHVKEPIKEKDEQVPLVN